MQVSPASLLRRGVPVYGVVQEEGQFIVEFPRAHVSSFSLGFNCTEAANMATGDWLRFGSLAIEHYRALHLPPMFCHEDLLLRVRSLSALYILVAEIGYLFVLFRDYLF